MELQSLLQSFTQARHSLILPTQNYLSVCVRFLKSYGNYHQISLFYWKFLSSQTFYVRVMGLTKVQLSFYLVSVAFPDGC